MMNDWTFLKQQPGYKNREAVQGEFFAAGSELGALIRESIQNSLDAALAVPEDQPVRVRIYASGVANAVRAETAQPYFKGAWDHFNCPQSGLQDPPDPTACSEFLVIEDFNTTGLIGDTRQHYEIPGEINPFYYFFRAEGQSGKSGDERGSWGIGKFVFPRGSRARTFFALTTRSTDGRDLLVGQSILKSHILDGEAYTPDGWFGLSDGTLTLPAEDHDLLQKFRDDFNLARRPGQTGLSIVIPWSEHVFNDDVSDGQHMRLLLQEVCREYFYPILTGRLEVHLEASGKCEVVDSNWLWHLGDDEAAEYGIDSDRWNQLKLVRKWVCSSLAQYDGAWIECPNAPRWGESHFDSDVVRDMKNALVEGSSIAVTMPATIKKRSPSTEHVEPLTLLFGPPHHGPDYRPLYLRDDLIISDVRARPIKDFTCVAISAGGELAEMLRKAENPAHTQWNHESEKFKSSYRYARAHLDLVRQAPKSVLDLLFRDNNEKFENILDDVFYIPDNRSEKIAPESGKSETSASDVTLENENDSSLSVVPVKAGFSVSGKLRGSGPRRPEITIATAYDCRSGNPLKKWVKADFDLASSEFEVSTVGVEVIERRGNIIKGMVRANAFKVQVRGFDTNRDLYVHPEFVEED